MFPVPWLSRLGSALGLLMVFFDRKHRHIAEVNLGLCFPDLKDRELQELLRSHFKMFGQSLMCTLGITWHRPKQRVEQWVRINERRSLDEALKQKKNIILMAPHFLGLELAWARLSSEWEMAGMYREPRRNIFHWSVHQKRTQFGGIALGSSGSAKLAIESIKEGKPFYYLPDLDQGKQARYVFAPFLGIPAATITALSRFARITDAVVIPCVTRQLSASEGYEINLLPALEEFPCDDPVRDAERVNALIAEQVKGSPEQYFWVHRRFKTRPEGEPDLY